LKSPAFQFYPSDFIADENVVLMTNQELGCYIKLMCYCWREGSIPADVSKIAKLCGEDGSAMAQLWLAIENCFDSAIDDASRLVHPRLEEERKKQDLFKKERKSAGKKGAKTRWRKGLKGDGSAIDQPSLSHSSAIGEPMAKHSSSSLSSSSSSTNNTSPPKRGRTVIPYSDDFESFWGFYPRRVEKKPAFAKWNALVKKGVSPDDIITACKHYLTACKGKDEQYIKHPATFLEKDRWMEFLAPRPPTISEPVSLPAVIASAQTEDTLRQIQEAQLRRRAGGGG
jgi:uncharacterized protein YdaU (DUF1376 family)